MRRITVLLIGMALISSLFAGRYAGDFMEIGSGIKSISMGGAYTSIADEGSAIYWNASGIAQIRDNQVFAMRAFLYNGLASYDNISYCHALPNGVTIGANWTRLTIDDIPIFSESHLVGTNIDQRSAFAELQLTAIPDGKFKSTDDLFQFAFAKHIHQDADLGWYLFVLPIDYYLGINFKYIKRQMFEYSGDGTGFDASFLLKTNLGVLIDQEWMGTIATGMNIQDISGTNITWDTQSRHQDEILFNTKFGISYNQPLPALESDFTIAYDKDFVYDKTDHFGAEFNYKNKAQLRMGVYDGNFAAGVGLLLSRVDVDYAFVTNNLGNTNRVGLTYKF
ncbi:MAG TPA: hypothetical protein PL139_03120 [Candidatus Cloacimonadota bacterium]|mgnify:CR=1 FL=1|jgi:hypothetical protein|nr:hypothetical protein [Candidatus Cloacimonadota bacterium]